MRATFKGIIGDVSFIDTDGIALPIFFSGCSRRCKNCHNPVLWDFNYGEEVKIEDVIRKLEQNADWYDSVAIMGGEPLEQLEGLLCLLRAIRQGNFHLKIWLYTGYEFWEIPLDVIELCDVIKCGRYIEELKTGSFPASTNQYLVKKGEC